MFGRGESNIFCCVDLPFMALTSASRSLLTTGFGVFAGKGCKPSRQLLAWHPRFGQAPRRTNSSPRGKARVYFRRRIPAITFRPSRREQAQRLFAAQGVRGWR